jgi:hypothetical protein
MRRALECWFHTGESRLIDVHYFPDHELDYVLLFAEKVGFESYLTRYGS